MFSTKFSIPKLIVGINNVYFGWVRPEIIMKLNKKTKNNCMLYFNYRKMSEYV